MSTYLYRRESKRGMALFLVVGYLAVASMLSTAFVVSVHREFARVRAEQHHVSALNIADGGLHSAVAHLVATPNGFRGESNVPLGVGRFTTSVTRMDARFHVVSTGIASTDALANHGVRVEADVRLHDGMAMIERYESRAIRVNSAGETP